MSDKIFALDKYRSTYQGRNPKYQDDEEGTWQVFGEDPNCDMGGPHHNPLLGTYTGRYIDVLSLAGRCKLCALVGSKEQKLSIKVRTPKWAELTKIREFYKECPEGYQVDHIIPLRGINVSGLHVLSNLQYLTISDNQSKSNKFNAI